MTTLWLLLWACTQESEQPFPYVTQGDHSQQPDDDVPDDLGNTEDTGTNADTDTDTNADTDTNPNSICDGRSTGTEIGQCGIDFELPDGDLEMVSLHQFAGDVIFLDLSSFT